MRLMSLFRSIDVYLAISRFEQFGFNFLFVEVLKNANFVVYRFRVISDRHRVSSFAL